MFCKRNLVKILVLAGMKKFLFPAAMTAAVAAAILAFVGGAISLVPLAGCSTTANGESTYTVAKATQVATAVKGAARSGVVLAWSKDYNSLAYFKAAALVMAKFVTGSDLSPTALQAALQATSVNELKTLEAQLAMNTVFGLYELYWADTVRAKVASNAPLRITIQGFIDGVLLGVADVSDLQSKATNK